MKTIDIKSHKKANNVTLKTCISLLTFMMVFSIDIFASVSLAEEQDKAAYNEFMSYVFMVVGFALVIIITGYATLKNKKEENSFGDSHHYLNHKHNNSHDPYFKRHGSHISRKQKVQSIF